MDRIIRTADEFITQHNHINYCEAIIRKDGLIEYAIPSHTEALLRMTGEPKVVIYDKMSIYDSPIHWLISYTGHMPVWTQGYGNPPYPTPEQIETLSKLIAHGLVANRIII